MIVQGHFNGDFMSKNPFSAMELEPLTFLFTSSYYTLYNKLHLNW